MSNQPENYESGNDQPENYESDEQGVVLFDKTLVYDIPNIRSHNSDEELEIRMHVFVKKIEGGEYLEWKITTNVPYNVHDKFPVFHPFANLPDSEFGLQGATQECSIIGEIVKNNDLLRTLFTHLTTHEILETQYGHTGFCSVVCRLIQCITILWD